MEIMDLRIARRKIPLVPAAGSARKQHHGAGELSVGLLEIHTSSLNRGRLTGSGANASINSLAVCGCKIGTVGYDKGKDGSLRVQCYTLSNEFRNFKTVCDKRAGASICEYGTSLRDSLVCLRTGRAFNKSIEGFWPGRLRSRGSSLHSHRQ